MCERGDGIVKMTNEIRAMKTKRQTCRPSVGSYFCGNPKVRYLADHETFTPIPFEYAEESHEKGILPKTHYSSIPSFQLRS